MTVSRKESKKVQDRKAGAFEDSWTKERTLTSLGEAMDWEFAHQAVAAFKDLTQGGEIETPLERGIMTLIQRDHELNEYFQGVSNLLAAVKGLHRLARRVDWTGFTASSATRRRVPLTEEQVGQVLGDPERASQIAFAKSDGRVTESHGKSGLVIDKSRNLVWADGTWFNKTKESALENRELNVLYIIARDWGKQDVFGVIAEVQWLEDTRDEILPGSLYQSISQLNKRIRGLKIDSVCGSYRIVAPTDFVLIEHHVYDP